MSSQLFQSVQQSFEKNGWQFEEIPQQMVLVCEFEAHHTKVPIHVQTFEEIQAVSVVAESSHVISGSRRLAALELLMRVNQSLTVGNFEMHWDTGAILFRATNIFSSPASAENIVPSLVRTAIVEMDGITPALATILRISETQLASLSIAGLAQNPSEAFGDAP